MYNNRYTSQEQCIMSPTLCRTIDTLVQSSVSLVLLFCRATNKVAQSSVLLVFPISWSGSRYSDQGPCVASPTFLELLIRWSRDYRNDRMTAMIIVVGYSNNFSPITSFLKFLGTISNWCDVTDIMFVCLTEFEILWSGLVSYESTVCDLMCSSNL